MLLLLILFTPCVVLAVYILHSNIYSLHLHSVPIYFLYLRQIEEKKRLGNSLEKEKFTSRAVSKNYAGEGSGNVFRSGQERTSLDMGARHDGDDRYLLLFEFFCFCFVSTPRNVTEKYILCLLFMWYDLPTDIRSLRTVVFLKEEVKAVPSFSLDGIKLQRSFFKKNVRRHYHENTQ